MRLTGLIAAVGLLLAASKSLDDGKGRAELSRPSPGAILSDSAGGDDWPGYGRTYGEQHFSPLGDINTKTVSRLGLEWSVDLPAGNPISGPLVVDGVLYTATGASIVRAFDVATGRLLWEHDPDANSNAGTRLRTAWGIRGLAWWKDKLYVGTVDGRLIALSASDGHQVWSAMTVEQNDLRSITGAPRAFDGKVIIGHAGADAAGMRGYVTTYDAETGKKLWRFYTVPGNPALGFEDAAQEMAAKTWAGEWWKVGGGGTVWDSFSYDADTDTVFLGTGNGSPWNRKVRSADQGDNLFLCSIVALDAKTGKYKWHYQINPGETWDYNATMTMHLADIKIGGVVRKVLMQVPKNGFLYVIDRLTGKLISADPVAKVTWAKAIDLRTGRPIEQPGARFPNGTSFEMWPGPNGAHSWLPSSYSPQSGLMYVPVMDIGYKYSDKNVDLRNWRHAEYGRFDAALTYSFAGTEGGSLLAWDPVARKERWRIKTVGTWNGAVLSTGGGLVFQGQANGIFSAYAATTGKPLWSFDAQAPVLAPPIAYRFKGRQYVTVLVGIGTSIGIRGDLLPMRVDYRTQARRILTFALDGKAALPKQVVEPIVYAIDSTYRPDPASEVRGGEVFRSCRTCHGAIGQSGGSAPELASSEAANSPEVFDQIVRGGALLPAGMPKFDELTDRQIADLRQYIQAETRKLASAGKGQAAK